VLYEGRVAGIADTADTDIARIGLLMTGGKSGDHAPEPAAGGGGG
jgi:hypothetical protein